MNEKLVWQQLAEELGFEFKEGIRPFFESPAIRKIEADVFKDMPEAVTVPAFVERIMSQFIIGIVTGVYKDYEVFLYRSAHSYSSSRKTTYYANIALFFKEPLQYGLEIGPVTFLKELARTLFPSKYVYIPDPELRQLISIKADQPLLVQRKIADRDIQQQLLDLYTFSKNFEISDIAIKYKREGHTLDKDEALEVMERMITIAPYV